MKTNTIPLPWVLALLGLVAHNPEAHACDGCNLFEYNAPWYGDRQQQFFIGTFYHHRVFSGYPHLRHRHRLRPERAELMHEPEAHGFMADRTPLDYERYQYWEVRTQIPITERITLQALTAYRRSEVYYERVLDFPQPIRDSSLTAEGWGDLLLAADYRWEWRTGTARHVLRSGAALVLPTGQSRQRPPAGPLSDPIIQPGTGAWSGVPRLQYLYGRAQAGVSTVLSYSLNGEGTQRYRFGNALNAQVLGYWQGRLSEQWLLVPQVGLYVEYADFHQQAGERVDLTGGSAHFAMLGLDLAYGRYTLQLTGQLPVRQRLHGPQIGNAGRLSIGLIWRGGA